MSWALFVDESGQDRRASPYEVLAGLAVEDRRIWPLIRQVSDAQHHFFGLRLFEAYGKEAKAQKLLNAKTFRLAGQSGPIAHDRRRELARTILLDGAAVTRERLTALAQAKIAYCRFVLDLARQHGGKAFAMIVPQAAPRPPAADALRKDYAYLFERFFDFLDSREDKPMGYLVFDELDRSASHLLLNQVSGYFVRTGNGRRRSRLVIPEPFFVHSDLTTLVQLADIVAYVVSWGVRLRGMSAASRGELAALAEDVLRLRHQHAAAGRQVWSFKVINDLRPLGEGR